MTTDTTRKARQQATKVAADRGAPTKPSDPPKGDRVSPVWPDVSGGRYVPVEVDEIVLDDGPAEKKAAIAEDYGLEEHLVVGPDGRSRGDAARAGSAKGDHARALAALDALIAVREDASRPIAGKTREAATEEARLLREVKGLFA
jgi:hypothetical protein